MFTIFGNPVHWTIEGAIVWDAAREVNDNRGVPFNAVVKLTFTGYDSLGDPQFVFSFRRWTQTCRCPRTHIGMIATEDWLSPATTPGPACPRCRGRFSHWVTGSDPASAATPAGGPRH